MSYHDYRCSQQLMCDDPPFYALIMAAMRKADTHNMYMLTRAWPEVAAELAFRYNAPGGLYPSETRTEDLVWSQDKPYYSTCAPEQTT